MAASQNGVVGQYVPSRVVAVCAGTTEPALNLFPSTEEKTAREIGWYPEPATLKDVVRIP